MYKLLSFYPLANNEKNVHQESLYSQAWKFVSVISALKSLWHEDPWGFEAIGAPP